MTFFFLVSLEHLNYSLDLRSQSVEVEGEVEVEEDECHPLLSSSLSFADDDVDDDLEGTESSRHSQPHHHYY